MTGEELLAAAEKEQAARRQAKYCVAVCAAAGCHSLGSTSIREIFQKAVNEAGLGEQILLYGTGCLGLCHAGPLVEIQRYREDSWERWLYHHVNEGMVAEIVRHHLGGDQPLAQFLYPLDDPFFRSQYKIVLENAGRINPERLEDYIGADGYSALWKAVSEMTPMDVVREVTQSGLRGCGGGGYPTGLKWSTVAKSKGSRKFVVCNADEGDPGAFMDRSILEGDPHRILEGMALAAYAIGAEQGYIYVRGEYPMAISRLKTAIRQAEKVQLLGNRILESAFNFRVDLRIGAGAFVCGEETALIGSIEGNRGTPRPRPPFPAEKGLWDMPTLINNVETFANVPAIVRNGGQWFSRIGTEKSKGTKVFALAGKIVHTGLIEVPMGISLRQVIFDIGGGIPDGKQFKAAQTGGPSGGCIPLPHLDLPIDYESLIKVGSMMGSGGLIVMDETSCMVDVARFFMQFCMDESCGKCVPCRAGTAQIYRILEKISSGTASLHDLELMEELCDLLKHTSLCGLGQTAPNPVVSTLRYFREEYLAHIEQKTCPAGVCRMGAPDAACGSAEPVQEKENCL